jgi:plasmid stabilization system protein ParE
MAWRVTLKKGCRDDLRAICRFISAANKRAARDVESELIRVALSLNSMPYRGAQLEGNKALRRLTHKHYCIIYQLNEKRHRVQVLRIWDMRQHPTPHVREPDPPQYTVNGTLAAQAAGSSA